MLSNNPCSIITRGFYTFYPPFQGQKRRFSLNNRIFSMKNWQIVVLKKNLIFLNHNRRSQLFLRPEFSLSLPFLERNSNEISSADKCQLFLPAQADDHGILQEFRSEKQPTNCLIFQQDKQIGKTHTKEFKHCIWSKICLIFML